METKFTYSEPTPECISTLWAEAYGDDICAHDMDLPIHPLRRMFWNIRGKIGMFLFGWWWWERRTR